MNLIGNRKNIVKFSPIDVFTGVRHWLTWASMRFRLIDSMSTHVENRTFPKESHFWGFYAILSVIMYMSVGNLSGFRGKNYNKKK